MGKEELENRKKFLKTVLSQYVQIVQKAGISLKGHEDTIDKGLDEIIKLNKEIENLNKKK